MPNWIPDSWEFPNHLSSFEIELLISFSVLFIQIPSNKAFQISYLETSLKHYGKSTVNNLLITLQDEASTMALTTSNQSFLPTVLRESTAWNHLSYAG